MPHFCVTLAGSGIRVPSSEGAAPIVGFYCVSRLGASSPSQASEFAISRCRENLARALEGKGGSALSPFIVVESIVRCTWLKAMLWPGGGFIFFPQDDA